MWEFWFGRVQGPNRFSGMKIPTGVNPADGGIRPWGLDLGLARGLPRRGWAWRRARTGRGEWDGGWAGSAAREGRPPGGGAGCAELGMSTLRCGTDVEKNNETPPNKPQGRFSPIENRKTGSRTLHSVRPQGSDRWEALRRWRGCGSS